MASPINHSALWLIVAIIALGSCLVGLWLTRKPSEPAHEPAPRSRRPSRTAKQKYLSRLDIIERDYKNGKINARRAYIRLSAVLRHFVDETQPPHSLKYMTLHEIKKQAPGPVAVRIERWYDLEFAAPEPTEDPILSINDIRELIRTWS